MAKIELEIDTKFAKELVDMAQQIAKHKTKEAAVGIIAEVVLQYDKINQTSFMHFSAGDIMILLNDVASKIAKL